MTTEAEQAAAIIRVANAEALSLIKTAASAAATVTAVAAEAGANLTPVLVAIGKIETKLDIYIEQHARFQAASEAGSKDVWAAIDSLRSSRDASGGFFSGAKAVWGLVLALPAGAIGMLIQSSR